LKKSINDVCKERDDVVRELKGVQKQNEELRAKLEDLLGTMMHQQEEAEMGWFCRVTIYTLYGFCICSKKEF
jgi:hypothetical protein